MVPESTHEVEEQQRTRITCYGRFAGTNAAEQDNPNPDLSDADGDRPRLDLSDVSPLTSPQRPEEHTDNEEDEEINVT